MDAAQLQRAIGCRPSLASAYADLITAACAFYDITTPARLAAFLAQIAHESGLLRYTTEIWGPTPAQQRYEGRRDLGNTQPGDGSKFRGHGLIQTTGRHNHARVRDRLREHFNDVPDFEAQPELLSQPQWAALSAADFWDEHGLNAKADAGDFKGITSTINGGLNGQAERVALWERAKAEFATSAEAAVKPLAPLAAAPAKLQEITAAAPAPIEVPAPAEEVSPPPQPIAADLPAATTKDELMPPFIAAALPYFLQMAPGLIRIFGDSPMAERNAKTAEMVAGLATKVTGETTAEGAVTSLQADPAKQAEFREAVHQSMDDLVAAFERINEVDQRNLAAARQYNAAEPFFIDLPWLKLRFIHVLSLLMVVFSGAFVLRFWGDLTPELKGAVITLMIIAGWNGTRDYWMGSSNGSAEKTAMMADRSRSR